MTRRSTPPRSRDRSRRWFPLAVTFFGTLLVWQIATSSGWLASQLFSSPWGAASSLWELMRSGTWTRHLTATMHRVFLGFGLGLCVGVVIGWLVGSSRGASRWIDPWLSALHPLPKIALLPLLLVVFGLGQAANIMLAALGAFFPVAISVAAGIRNLDPRFFVLMRSLNAPRGMVLCRVILPASLAAVFTGGRIGFNVALTLSLAAEFVAAADGIGQQLWFAWQVLDVDRVFAWLLTVAAFGLLFQATLDRLLRLFTPWAVDSDAFDSALPPPRPRKSSP